MKVALMVAGTWTTSASTVPLNAWTHVAVTRDGVTNRFYINGVLDCAVAASGSLYQSGSPFLIGRQGLAAGNVTQMGLGQRQPRHQHVRSVCIVQ